MTDAVPIFSLTREEMRARAAAFARRWSGQQREEQEAKSFLDEFFGVFGRDLYDPLTMPSELVIAHKNLDRLVDRAYRTSPFTGDRDRVEHRFALYDKLTNPLLKC
jgi:hypothetical protein